MATGNLLSKTPDLSGRISAPDSMTGKLSAAGSLYGTIAEATAHVIKPPEYTGEYVVTPKAREDQILETKGKQMAENVTVKEIPVYRVSNNSGGQTVYIAGTKELMIL